MDDPDFGWAKLSREGRCRLCRHRSGEHVYWTNPRNGERSLLRIVPQLSRHHLVPRGMGGAIGDDVDENMVPLCGHGTYGCHGDVEHWRADARHRLRLVLALDEIEYIIRKRGEAWLERSYPSRPGTPRANRS